MKTDEILTLEKQIRSLFEANFSYLKETSGHTIDPNMKERAFEQVLYYCLQKTGSMDEVSRTKAKLSLPEQVSPHLKVPYTIEGEVDVIHEDSKTSLYDISTRSKSQIYGNLDEYSEQMNIYAHIWKGLKKENEVNEMGIISTHVPDEVRKAIDYGNEESLFNAIENWDPVVPISYSNEKIEKMIQHFGEVVEKIENCEFGEKSVEELNTVIPGTGDKFGSKVCGNCDIRFSCKNYRKYKGWK